MTPSKRCLLTPILITLIFLIHTLLFAHFEKQYDHKIKSSQLSSSSRHSSLNCSIYPRYNESILTDRRSPDCRRIIAGDPRETCYWTNYHRSTPSDGEFLESIERNPSHIIDRYPRAPNSLEEAQFPLAFSISMHKNVYQFEQLLRLIYWPQNLYCIHVDRRATSETKSAVARLVSNFPNNVFLTESEPVYWAGFGVLRAVLNCMNTTLRKFGREHKWRYFINLSGMDFPLKTNLELVRILKILNGSNDVEFGYEFQFSRYWFSYRQLLDSDGNPYAHAPDTRKQKPPAPDRLKVYKGNLAASLSREFVEFVIGNEISRRFIDWLGDTDTADEHLWSTLNYNLLANAPGSFPAECHNQSDQLSYFSRYAIWRGGNNEANPRCSGRYVRDVCIFGVRSVRYLTKPRTRELFANKFYVEFQSAAFDCMREWFEWKTRSSIVEIDEEYYRNLPNVRFRNEGRLERAKEFCETEKLGDARRLVPDGMKKLVKGGVVRRVDIV